MKYYPISIVEAAMFASFACIAYWKENFLIAAIFVIIVCFSAYMDRIKDEKSDD